MPANLEKKRVLITGASGGVGSALACAFAEAGAELLLVSRTSGFPVDFRETGAADRVMAHARALWPSLDVLVNNAAMLGPVGALTGNDFTAWTETMQVNLLAPVRLSQLAAAWMLESGGGGCILNISGGGAASSRPNFSAYAAAKTALVRTTEILADELAGTGIRVNAIAPGIMKTRMLDDVVAAGIESVGAEYGSVLKARDSGGVLPEKAARLAVFLASPAGSAISGKLISAQWDPWEQIPEHADDAKDAFTLRRVVPDWAK